MPDLWRCFMQKESPTKSRPKILCIIFELCKAPRQRCVNSGARYQPELGCLRTSSASLRQVREIARPGQLTAAALGGSGRLRLPADGTPQEGGAQGGEAGDLCIVLAVTMAASRRLMEQCRVSHGLQLGGHLAGMAGMDAVVPASGGQQDRWVRPARLGQVVGRKVLQKGPVLRP